MRDDEHKNDLYDEVERRALFDLPEEEAEEPPDLLSQLRAREGDAAEVETAKDLTLGGYIELHNRVPAFEGIDGQPYTVDIDADETGEADQPWSAFFVFIRWAETGAGIMDHCLSGDLARGASADEARAALLDRTLYEVKAELDAAIERKRLELAE